MSVPGTGAWSMALRILKRLAHTVLLVLIIAAVGKICQYVGVAYLGPEIGFDAASAVGIMPFLIALMILRSRFPAFLSVRQTWRS